MAFERFNKKVKTLVGNKNHPEKSVANAMIRDAGIVTTTTPHYTYCVSCMHSTHHTNNILHSPTTTAGCFIFWSKKTSLCDPALDNSARTGMIGEGKGWSPTMKEALDLQEQRTCMCCGLTQLRASAKQYRTAEVAGVKVYLHHRHTHAHSHAHTHTHTALAWMHTHTAHTLADTYTYTYTYTHRARAGTYTYINSRGHTNTHTALARTHTHTHIYTHCARSETHSHTHTHTHRTQQATHTHTHAHNIYHHLLH